MAVPEMIKYRREFIGAFNTSVSLLNDRFTEESMDMGRSAIFDVSAVGGRMATRSIDGRIPRTNVSDTQVTATLTEYVKKFEVTDFEAFTSQSDERAKMNHRIMESVNQEIDYSVLTELTNATNTAATGSGSAITINAATRAIAELSANSVPINPNDVTWIISPIMEAILLQLAAYSSADYISTRPFENPNMFENKRKMRNFLNVGWIVHPNLPGAGTATCTTYLVHRKALGLALPIGQIKYGAGYDDQDHYHYCSATLKAGAKILQQSGILKFVHNDS